MRNIFTEFSELEKCKLKSSNQGRKQILCRLYLLSSSACNV
uniref:Uncharacterized protein n=1 Tax=Arundo donax TaxID=35708 RepID=A0A0A9ABR2_ARUDO